LAILIRSRPTLVSAISFASRRTSIRFRLATLFTTCFIALGVVVVGLDYLLVRAHLYQTPTVEIQIDPSTLEYFNSPHEFQRQVVDAALRALLVDAGAALAVAALISSAVGLFVANRALRPVHQITARAHELSNTQGFGRIQLTGPEDELKELADTIDGLLAQIERGVEVERRFIANAAHELRTPLALERTLIEVALNRRDASVSALRDSLSRLLSANLRTSALLESLLSMSRAQAGALDDEAVDLTALVEESLAEVDDLFSRKELSLNARLEPTLVRGDGILLKAAVRNLIENAAKHNTVRGTVDVTLIRTLGSVELSITNSGRVVPSDQVDSLVEPFRRGDDRVESAGGAGIGLAVVDAVVRAHHGELALHPDVKGGLRVCLILPFGPWISVKSTQTAN
jgi:signal transduction histidine kinase